MASRIVHFALARLLAGDNPCLNRNRFFFGSVMPDAGPIYETHFLKNIDNERKRIHDLSGFRNTYGEKLISDDLYLGYYLHLLEDLIFRHYVFEVIGFDPVPKGNIDGLHHDYELLNRYVISKYGLKDHLSVPQGIEREELCLPCFDIPSFMEEFHADFTRSPEGSLRFFTEEMTDTYISMAYEICLKEMRAVFEGSGYLKESDWAWNRHHR